jgi:ubiquinone/menaquinone biosynthesis C-methylase UbiE
MIHNLSHDLVAPPQRDERTRQEFVASLRSHVLVNMAASMQQHFQDQVEPEFVRREGRAPANGDEVHDAMLHDPYFCFYSAIRYNAQQMVFESVIPLIDRELENINDKAASVREADDEVGGSLTLNPDLKIPRSVANIDVHLAPGGYHTEYDENDTSAGAIYDTAINVFAFNQMGRNLDDIGYSFANYVKHVFPEFKPGSILDCGCTIGCNTVPWALTFPEADVTAIDVAHGLLRYASARAKRMGAKVNFMQMNATELDFPDNSFDVVFSSMFLHELPLKDIRAFLKEAHRVLKPGGLLLNMELPPNSRMSAYDGFYLDWDCYYNKEPYYKPFRDQDYLKLCTDAGFKPEQFLEVVMPRFTYTPLENYLAEINDNAIFDDRTGRMSEMIRWYGFGAWKQ